MQLLAGVHGFHGIEQLGLHTGGFGRMDQGLHVLGEAGAAVPNAGIDELVADAAVRTDAVTHVAHVGAHTLADGGDLVDEGDLGGQHAVGGVFGHFSAADAHDDQFVTGTGKGRVQFAHGGGGLVRRGADDHAVRLHEVGDGVAFLQELGVGDHLEVEILAAGSQFFGDDGAHTVGSAHRHRRLVHHDEVVFHGTTDLAGHLLHVVQVAGTVFSGRGTHADEGAISANQTFRQAGGELQAAIGMAAAHHGFQAGLENMHGAGIQAGHNILVDIDAGHGVAHFSEAGSTHQTHIAGADDTQFHMFSPLGRS